MALTLTQQGNYYENQRNRLRNLSSLYSDEDWDYVASGSSPFNLDMYVKKLETADAKGITSADITAIYGDQNADSETRVMQLYTELLADREKATEKRATYKTDELGNYVLKDGTISTPEQLSNFNDVEIIPDARTDYEYYRDLLIDKNKQLTEMRNAEIDEERKASMSGFKKWITGVGASIMDFGVGVSGAADDFVSFLNSFGEGIIAGFQGQDFSDAYVKTALEYEGWNQEAEDWLLDYERKYTNLRNLDGSYTNYGKIVGGVATSLGEMFPSMLISAAGGGVASLMGGTSLLAGGVAKAASYTSQLVFYAGMSERNLKEMYTQFAESKCSVSTDALLTNAYIKSALQWSVEVGLGKILGTTSLDKLTYGRSMRSTASKTFTHAGFKRIAKDFLQEGLEEVLQDTSDFLVDRAYMDLIDENFGDVTDITFQGLMDSFIIGGIASFAGNAAGIIKQGGLNLIGKGTYEVKSTISKEDAKSEQSIMDRLSKVGDTKYQKLQGTDLKYKKLSAIAAWEYGLDMQSFITNFNTVKDGIERGLTGKYSKRQADAFKKAYQEMYSSARMIATIYETIGEERFTAANNLLSVLTDNINNGIYNPGLNYDKVADDLLKEFKKAEQDLNIKIIKAKMSEKVVKLVDGEVTTEVDERVANELKKLGNATASKEVVVTKRGKNAVKDKNNNIIVPEKELKVGSDLVLQDLSEQELIETVLSVDKRFTSLPLKQLRELYSTYHREENVDDEQLVRTLLFDPKFFQQALYNSDTTMYTFIHSLVSLVNGLAFNTTYDGVYKKKVQTTIKNLKKVLIPYLIYQQGVIPNLIKDNILTQKEYQFIMQQRLANNPKVSSGIYGRIKTGTLTKDDDTELKQICQLISKRYTYANDVYNAMHSAVASEREQAIKTFSRMLLVISVGKYDGIRYPRLSTPMHVTYAQFLESLGLNLQTVLNPDILTDSEVTSMREEYHIAGKISDIDVLSLRNQQLRQYTQGVYKLEIVNNKVMINKVITDDDVIRSDVQYITVIDEGVPTEVIGNVTADEYGSLVFRSGLSDSLAEFFDIILSKDVNASTRAILTLNDVFNNLDLLDAPVRRDIKDMYSELTYQTAFLFLRDMIQDNSNAYLSIGPDRAGNIVLLDVLPYGDVLKPKIDYANVKTIGDVIQGKFLKGFLKDVKIKYGKRSAMANPTTNAQYNSATNTITVYAEKGSNTAVFAILHEFQHTVQFFNQLNSGFTSSYMTSTDDPLFKDIEKHVPIIFTPDMTKKRKLDLANWWLYRGTGEYQAFGVEIQAKIDSVKGSEMPNLTYGGQTFYPTVITEGQIILPWGTTYKRKKGTEAQQQTIGEMSSKDIDSLYNIRETFAAINIPLNYAEFSKEKSMDFVDALKYAKDIVAPNEELSTFLKTKYKYIIIPSEVNEIDGNLVANYSTGDILFANFNELSLLERIGDSKYFSVGECLPSELTNLSFDKYGAIHSSVDEDFVTNFADYSTVQSLLDNANVELAQEQTTEIVDEPGRRTTKTTVGKKTTTRVETKTKKAKKIETTVKDKTGKEKVTRKYTGYENRINITENMRRTTNLRNWKTNQVAPNTYKFVVNATQKLDRKLWTKIQKGTLTFASVKDFIANAENVDQYTWDLITKYYFPDSPISTFKELKDMVDNAAEYYAIYIVYSKTPDGELILNKLNHVEDIEQIRSILSQQPALLKEFNQNIARYTTGRTRDFNIDLNNLRILFLRQYDGTPYSAFTAANFARNAAKEGWRTRNYEPEIYLESSTKKTDKDSKKTTIADTLADTRKEYNLEDRYNEPISLESLGLDKFSKKDKLKVLLDTFSKKQIVEFVKTASVKRPELLTKENMDKYVSRRKALAEEKYGNLSDAEFSELFRNMIKYMTSSEYSELNQMYASIMSSEVLGEDPTLDLAYYTNYNFEERKPANVVAAMKGRVNTLNRNTTPKQKLKIVEVNNDIFEYNKKTNSIVLKSEAYQTNLAQDKSKWRNMATEELVLLEDRISSIIDKVKDANINIKAQQADRRFYERVIKEKDAEIKALKKELKEPKILYIKDEPVVVTGDTPLPSSLEKLLKYTFESTRATEIQFVENGNKRHVRMGMTKFIQDNIKVLESLTQDDVNEIIEFYHSKGTITPTDKDSVSYKTIELATLSYILSTINNEAKPLYVLSIEQAQQLDLAIESLVTPAFQIGAVWREALKMIRPVETIINEYASSYSIEFDDNDVQNLIHAISTGNSKEIGAAKKRLYDTGRDKYEGRKRYFIDRLLQFERTAMLSGPGTWIRNIVSNVNVMAGNIAGATLSKPFTNAIDKIFKRKGVAFEGQYKIQGTKVSTKTAEFIKTAVLDSGLYKSIQDGLNKFDIRKMSDMSQDESLAGLIASSIAASLSRETSINRKNLAGKVYGGWYDLVMKAISDDPFIKKSFLRYLGKIMEEDNVATNKGITKEVQSSIVSAYKLAANDYMHKTNAFTTFDFYIRSHAGKYGYFAWKQIAPFAAASWNWFSEGLNYTPLGLVKSIVKYAKLETTIKNAENAEQHGKAQVSSRFTKYMTARDFGKGIIGTVGFAIALIFGLTGVAKIEIDDEDKRVKLKVGDTYVDITQVFGTQGIMVGLAIVSAVKEEDDFFTVLEAAATQMVNDSIFTDLYNTFRFSDPGEYLVNMPLQITSMFIPNMIKSFSVINKYKTKYEAGYLGKLEKLLVQSIPGITYALPKIVDPYTGEYQVAYKLSWLTKTNNKLMPVDVYPYNVTELEAECVRVKATIGELTGEYKIAGEEIEFTAKQKETLNIYYGKLTNQTLTQLVNNNVRYKVLDEKTNKYIELYYKQMTDKQKKSALTSLESKNRTYAKVYMLTNDGYKYYAGATQYAALRALGITKNVYKKTLKLKGFVKIG